MRLRTSDGTWHFADAERRGSGRGRTWRMTCSCGAEGLARPTRQMALADLEEHLAAVCDVPPAERCRMPRQHRLAVWSRCELCAGQISIFDLEEEAS